jgi:hypothetical protein
VTTPVMSTATTSGTTVMRMALTHSVPNGLDDGDDPQHTRTPARRRDAPEHEAGNERGENVGRGSHECWMKGRVAGARERDVTDRRPDSVRHH